MKLIDLLVQELPKLGGWPEGRGCITCNEDEGKVFAHGHLLFITNKQITSYEGAIHKEQYEAALAASQRPAWNGEGLPPVGCECEAYDGDAWYPSVVVGHYDGFAFAWCYDHRITFTVNEIDSHCFRPIRSEAERKRDATVDEIASLIGRGTFSQDAESIYDAIAAGKIPGIRLE